jgi:hypothetical protein
MQRLGDANTGTPCVINDANQAKPLLHISLSSGRKEYTVLVYMFSPPSKSSIHYTCQKPISRQFVVPLYKMAKY